MPEVPWERVEEETGRGIDQNRHDRHRLMLMGNQPPRSAGKGAHMPHLAWGFGVANQNEAAKWFFLSRSEEAVLSKE